jgi:glycosyltransferase involved in cell wall biosynthesis
MRVVVVSGIWPPDVGGPASHAPELAAYLLARGHGVEAVTTAAAQPPPAPYPVRWVSRERLAGVRHAAVAWEVFRRARHCDVVYATSMTRRAALGATLARRPLVLKLTADEAYERERRSGRFGGDLDAFQAHRGGIRVRLLRATRNAAIRRARRVFAPSEYLRRIVVGWGIPGDRVSVIPNPAPDVPPLPPRDEIRQELGLSGPTLGFAGRLMAAKALGVALSAVAAVPDVSLVVVGDGPDRETLERQAAALGLDGRVRFLGSRSRDDVLRTLYAADAALLSSRWENFPHLVVEALAVGTPVIATSVGGVPEVVRDGENGLLVPAGDAEALAAAIRRLLDEPGLRDRLAAAAAPSVADLAPASLLARIEATLLEAAPRAPSGSEPQGAE